MRWQRTLWIIFFAQLVTSMGFSIIYPFLPLYVNELGTNTNISLSFWSGMVFSSQAITMTISAPIWGAIADRYGRKLMVQRAIFSGVILLVLMGFARSAEELTLLRTIQGLTTGTVAAASALVAAETPRERMGYSMGIVQLALWLGVAIGPMIGGIIADSYGFQMPNFVAAVMLFIAGLAVHFGVKENFNPEHRKKNRNTGFVSEWKHVLGMRGVLQTYSIRFMMGLCRSMLTPVIPLYVMMLMTESMENSFTLIPEPFAYFAVAFLGISTITGIVVGAESAASTVSGIYFGRLGDRIGHRRVIMLCSVIGFVFFLPQAFAVNVWQLLALMFLGGFAVGGLVAAPSALLTQFTERGEEGAVFGLDNSVVAGARAIAPLLGSGIAAIFGLRVAFIVASVMIGSVFLIAMFILPKNPKQHQDERLSARPVPAD
jgi:DHA1 family multidrug resistance protein-like MFS transporter